MSVAEPRRVLKSDSAGVSRVLAAIGALFEKGPAAPRFVGFLGFNAGRAFDSGIRRLPLRPHPLKTPAAYFGDYPAVVKMDFKNKTTQFYWRGAKRDGESLALKIKTLLRASAFPRPEFLSRREREARLSKEFQFKSVGAFSGMVSKAKSAIANGDIYQANLSIRFSGRFDKNPLVLYRLLSERNPSPYSCLLKCGDDWLVSASPELLVGVAGRRAVTRPIAGTRPRGNTSAADARRRGQLLMSPKERAEHVMLVDLERNDLGRVCAPGSVRVTDRYAIERYSHVMHIVSQVEGRLAAKKNSVDALAAVFPGGTITGCPKIRSIELIEELEKEARGPFYGSAGFFGANGDAVFNILIRTALIRNGRVFVQAGAGIVADSNPRREYRETLAKAAALLEAIHDCPS